METDPEISEYLQQFTSEQKEKVFDAEKYIGIAAEKVEKVAGYWEAELGI